MTSLTITTGPKRGDFVLRDADGRRRGSLSAGWTLRQARIETDDGRWALRRRGWWQVHTTGAWEKVDLVVLTACFALVLQHRRRAVVAASGT